MCTYTHPLLSFLLYLPLQPYLSPFIRSSVSLTRVSAPGGWIPSACIRNCFWNEWVSISVNSSYAPKDGEPSSLCDPGSHMTLPGPSIPVNTGLQSS